MKEVLLKAKAAQAAALQLANVPTDIKNTALYRAASAVLENRELVLNANANDVELAEGLRKRGKLSRRLWRDLNSTNTS